jgi:hypothetical protein
MATNTCMTVIKYSSLDDLSIEPFCSLREEKAEQMFNEGKTESFTNHPIKDDVPNPLCSTVENPIGVRFWVDHAAAQEFIDWMGVNSAIHNITIVSMLIEDLPPA